MRGAHAQATPWSTPLQRRLYSYRWDGDAYVVMGLYGMSRTTGYTGNMTICIPIRRTIVHASGVSGQDQAVLNRLRVKCRTSTCSEQRAAYVLRSLRCAEHGPSDRVLRSVDAVGEV